MTLKLMLIVIAGALTACSRQGPVTDAERREAIAEISTVIDSMNAAWRRADFVASDRPLLDEGLMTFNGSREAASATKADDAAHPTNGIAGQYISDYTPRFDVLTRDLAVTSSENDYARIAMDHTREPLQTALMTLVWKRTGDGWHILHYHESTRPKARRASAASLAPYPGVYKAAAGPDLRIAVAEGTLTMTRGDAPATRLEPLTDPTFGLGDDRVTFVRNRDGSAHGLLVLRHDGASDYFWRLTSPAAQP